MANWASKTGAIIYALWGILHVIGGGMMLSASFSGLDAFLGAQTGSMVNFSSNGIETASNALLGVAAYHSFNLVWIGGLVTAIAIGLGWKNKPSAFWLNLCLVGFIDLGYVFFILKPGIMKLSQGWPGLFLFAVALIFSIVGRRKAKQVIY